MSYTHKNFRRIINSRKGFITEKFVYERAQPLDKPFFLEKTEKGFAIRCKVINPRVDSLFINHFSIDQPDQPSHVGFIITYKNPTSLGLIRLINGKRVYEERINPWVYHFATYGKPFSVFSKKKKVYQGVEHVHKRIFQL